MVSFINIINKVSYEYLLSSKYDIDWHSMEINITVVKIYVVVLSETFQSVTDRQDNSGILYMHDDDVCNWGLP